MQENRILVSIIVPVLNTDIFFLNKCLNSIQKQSYKNIEVLLVDGGSNKICLDCLKNYCYADKRFRLLSASQGVSNQRNVGIDSTNGDYILFIDSDDFISNNFIESLFDKIILENCDIVAPIIYKYKYDGNQLTEKYLMTSNFAEGYINNNNYFINSTSSGIVHPIKLYKRTVIGKIRFRSDLSHGEDMIFNYEISKNGFKYGVSKEASYFYTGLIGDNSAKKRLKHSSIKIVAVVSKLLKENKKTNENNLNGLKDQFYYLFYTYFDVCAKNFKIKWLLYLFPFKFKYLKQRLSFKRKIYILFPLMITLIKKVFCHESK